MKTTVFPKKTTKRACRFSYLQHQKAEKANVIARRSAWTS
ncbi:hypothetical protein F443_19473 [Phytophthora nicotianae P1569]|uniref:Uncharacterized protein n=1 Tax=Phytophthora nicotianae P1569 TaxID=1317065 RepID=V9E6M0_PHYNI|nr:hypothetical protein F443_19473 [Phytophthora nicotianae P1569]